MSYNSRFDDNAGPPGTYAGPAAEIDFGLRQHMMRVYNFMAAGLAVTGIVAYAAIATGFYQQIVGTPLIWLVMLAPLKAGNGSATRFGKPRLKRKFLLLEPGPLSRQ